MRYFKTKDAIIYIGGIALIPLLYWKQDIIFSGLLTLISATGIFLLDQKRPYPRLILVALVLLPIFLATLSSNGIINPIFGQKISVDKEKLFMFQSDSKTALFLTTQQFQIDLWRFGIPFPRSEKVHNLWVSSLNVFFRNLTDFLYLPNFYRHLYFANLYLIVLGVIEVFRRQQQAIKIGAIVSVTVFLLVIGFSLNASREASLYPLLPWVLYLAGLGSVRANRLAYLTLFIVQIILLGWR